MYIISYISFSVVVCLAANTITHVCANHFLSHLAGAWEMCALVL